MYCNECPRYHRTSFVVCLVAGILISGLQVSAQGWRAAGRKGPSKAQPVSAAKPTTPAAATTETVKSAKPAKSAKSAKSAKPAKPKSSTVSAGHEKGTPPPTDTAPSTTTKGSRERRVSNADTATTTSAGSGSKGPARTADPAAKSAKIGRCDPEKDERLDLSGTYTGQVNYPAGGMLGDATLTITGNRFTLTSGGTTQGGNITAVATCNYTAVAMMFGQWKTPQPGEPVQPPLPMLSLTAVRKGDQLTLKTSPSERREFSFAPGGKK